MSDHRPAYDRFVAELARYPDMINRLQAWHPLVGDCEACRPPGTHVAITAPCSIRLSPSAPERSPTPAPAPAETDPSLRRLGRRSTNTSGRSTRAHRGSTRFLLPPRLPDHEDEQVLHALR